jgi:hypothetical protein
MINEDILENCIILNIRDKIIKHHEIYRFPVKAELWEDIFDQCINPTESNWIGGGHDVGSDVTSKNNNLFKLETRFQLKSGNYNSKTDMLKWNGHRTTQYKTLKDKIDFISTNHSDYYVMLARDKRDWKMNNRIYRFMMFESEKIDYSTLIWSEKYNKYNELTGWVGVGNGGYKAEINRSMSDQLWTTCKLSTIAKSYKIEI